MMMMMIMMFERSHLFHFLVKKNYTWRKKVGESFADDDEMICSFSWNRNSFLDLKENGSDP